MSGARISVFRERDATGKRERGCFEGGRESLVLERPCLGAYSVAGRVGGRSRPLLWLYNVALTLPSISRALFNAQFTCLTPLLHCTTPRALNLPWPASYPSGMPSR